MLQLLHVFVAGSLTQHRNVGARTTCRGVTCHCQFRTSCRSATKEGKYDLHVYTNALMKHYKLLSWQGEACMVKIISLSQSNLIVRLYSKVRQITSFRSWAFLSSIGEVISGFIKSSLDYTDFWLCTIIYNPKTVIFSRVYNFERALFIDIIREWMKCHGIISF